MFAMYQSILKTYLIISIFIANIWNILQVENGSQEWFLKIVTVHTTRLWYSWSFNLNNPIDCFVYTQAEYKVENVQK